MRLLPLCQKTLASLRPGDFALKNTSLCQSVSFLDEEAGPGDAPETGSSISAAFALMPKNHSVLATWRLGVKKRPSVSIHVLSCHRLQSLFTDVEPLQHGLHLPQAELVDQPRIRLWLTETFDLSLPRRAPAPARLTLAL